MPLAEAGSRLVHLTGETLGGAGVHDLVVPQLRGRRHLSHILDHLVLAADGHVAVAHHRGHILDLAALRQPFRETTVQHGDIHLPHQAE